MVAPHHVVVATPQRVMLHRPRLTDPWDGYSSPMTGAGHPVTTRGLLDGAIASATSEKSLPKPPSSLLGWVWRLVSLYHTTHATPRLMAAAAERFAAAGREVLAAWSREKVREETGHDTLALRDLAALEFDAAALVASVVPRRAGALVDWFEQLVHGASDPIGCVGYAYALERLAAERTPDYVARVQASLGTPVDATRCLRVHSAVGADVAHADEIVALVAGLTAPERTAVAVAAHRTARILFDPGLTEPVDAASLDATFRSFRVASPRIGRASSERVAP